MAPSYDQEIVAIREWLKKEDYIPYFDDFVIKKFLHSSYGSLEKTKRCIENFCVRKCSMPQIYTNRDPLSPELQTAFSITCISNHVDGDTEQLFYELNDPELEKYVFYDVVKSITLVAEHWVLNSNVFAERQVVFIDMKHFFLRIIPKTDLFVLKQFISYLLESLPIRVKEVHAYNCPSYVDKLYGIVKPVLPQEIRDNFHFHHTMDSLYKAYGKERLPMELGGKGSSMKECHRRIVKDTETIYRSTFQDDNYWKADLSRRVKSTTIEEMNGSFKTLDID